MIKCQFVMTIGSPSVTTTFVGLVSHCGVMYALTADGKLFEIVITN